MTSPQRFNTLPNKLHHLAVALMLASSVSLLLPLCASAVALGEAAVHSALGQKLDADIEIAALSALESESLSVRLSPPEVFAGSGLDYSPVLRSVRLSVEKRGERSVIHLSSELAVADPVLILLIEINANGNRTTRQYALLLDPPAVNDEPRSAGAVPQLPVIPAVPQSGDSEADVSQIPAGRHSTDEGQRVSPASDKMRIVRRGDTLAKIAQQMPVRSASPDQLLIALLQANPKAFADNNIHRIKTGSVLRIPDEAEIKAISPAEARRKITLQTADFHRYRSALAAASSPARSEPAADVPADRTGDRPADAPANRSSSGNVGVQQLNAGNAAGSGDQLKLSAPQGAMGKQPGDANALNQIASEKALNDAKARIAELEKNVGDMQQQLALRNQSMADAQHRAEAALPASSLTPQTPTPHKEVATEARKPPAAAKPAPPPQAGQDMTARLTGVIGQWLQDPRPLLAALGLLGVLALLLRLRGRARSAAAPSERVEPAAEAQSVFGQAGGRNVDTSNSVFHSNFVPSVSQLDANEVDAVAEADVYIAYGRDEQAEDILLDALKQHAGRHALRVKLLEIYAARKDLQKFGTLAAELSVLTQGQGADWQQAVQLGRQLDPGNPLYGGLPAMPPLHSPLPASPAPAAPPAGVTRPVPGVPHTNGSLASASSVEDFGIKLEGLLDERRKDQGEGLALVPQSSAGSLPADAADFQLAGIGAANSAVSGTAGGTAGISPSAEQIALKTKIDLALACQEIGDKEGARELLTEVAATRHPELAGRAQSLLLQLA